MLETPGDNDGRDDEVEGSCVDTGRRIYQALLDDPVTADELEQHRGEEIFIDTATGEWAIGDGPEGARALVALLTWPYNRQLFYSRQIGELSRYGPWGIVER